MLDVFVNTTKVNPQNSDLPHSDADTLPSSHMPAFYNMDNWSRTKHSHRQNMLARAIKHVLHH